MLACDWLGLVWSHDCHVFRGQGLCDVIVWRRWRSRWHWEAVGRRALDHREKRQKFRVRFWNWWEISRPRFPRFLTWDDRLKGRSKPTSILTHVSAAGHSLLLVGSCKSRYILCEGTSQSDKPKNRSQTCAPKKAWNLTPPAQFWFEFTLSAPSLLC